MHVAASRTSTVCVPWFSFASVNSHAQVSTVIEDVFGPQRVGMKTRTRGAGSTLPPARLHKKRTAPTSSDALDHSESVVLTRMSAAEPRA